MSVVGNIDNMRIISIITTDKAVIEEISFSLWHSIIFGLWCKCLHYLIAVEEEEEGFAVRPLEPEAVACLAAVLRGELGPHEVRRQRRCFGQQLGERHCKK